MSHENVVVPRQALWAAAALIGGTLALTGATRAGLIDPAPNPARLRAERHVAPVTSRELRFLDQRDGAIAVVGADGVEVARILPGIDRGFVRGVMRALARERRQNGVGDGPPFRLTLYRDGELTLTDTATRRTIELNSFGATNRDAFATLLKAPRA